MSTYIGSWIYALKNGKQGEESQKLLKRLIDQRDNEGLVRMSFTLGAAMPAELQEKLDEHYLMQIIFNAVCLHIKTQRSQAVGEGGAQCMYRTQDGRSCAIGCLIPDEFFERYPHVNVLPIDSIVEIGLLPDHLRTVPIGFLKILQKAHDKQPVKNPETFVANCLMDLTTIATWYDLDPKEARE